MTQFFANLLGNIWGTIVMSLIPLIELKGGIVFARGAGLSFFSALGLAFLGSTLVFIPVYFLLKPILTLLKKIKGVNKFAIKVENYFKGRADDTLKERKGKGAKGLSEKALKMLGVFIFVAIPLPMTGVWTGTAVAVFLDLKFKDVCLPIILGNLIAGLIISLLAELCLSIFGTAAALDYILYGLFALALVLLVITIVKMNKSSSKEKDDNI